LDETAYWIELILESGMLRDDEIDELDVETEELISIFVSVAKSAKQRRA